MASKNYSASRLKCFEGCVLNYKYKYVDGWKAEGLPKAEVTSKGLALHETFELYKTGMSAEEATKILEKNMETNPVDEEKFNVREGLSRFLIFWDKFVKPLEEQGYKIEKETWVKAQIEGEPFIGALDLLLDHGDKVVIVDYKTASSISTGSYRSQLLLYAYMIGLNRGWDFKQISENVKLYVFFPLGKVTAKSADTPEKQALNCVRELEFNAMDVDENAQHFIVEINEIKSKDWANVQTSEANVAFACQWCDYAGSVPNKDGFKGCPCSYEKGYRALRTVKYVKGS